jgi:DNA-directed RNA polymerase subunit RPC12/RpoP
MASNKRATEIYRCIDCGEQYQRGVIGRKRTCAAMVDGVVCGGKLVRVRTEMPKERK